jgi:hypothetical protein
MARIPDQKSSPKRPGISPGRFAFCIAVCGIITMVSAASAKNAGNEFQSIFLNYNNIAYTTNGFPGAAVEDSTEAELDSLERELDALDAELDALDADTTETNWTLNAGTKYRSQEQRSGVDISNGLPTLNTSLSIGHAIGLELSASTSHRINSKKLNYQDFSLGVNYVYEAADWVDVSAGLTRTRYQSDTTNALAGASLIVSLMADFYIKQLIIDVSLDRFTGEDASTALSVTTLYSLKYNDLSITPMLSASLLSYEITTKRLQAIALVKKTTPKTKQALTLSSVVVSVPLSHPIFQGFSLNFTPTFSYSPIKNVAGSRTQFIVNAGVKYSLDF